jgi:hypothetical protein
MLSALYGHELRDCRQNAQRTPTDLAVLYPAQTDAFFAHVESL